MPHPITRRKAVASLTGALLLGTQARTLEAAANATSSAMTSGSYRHSVCKWCYKNIPLADLAAAAKGLGLDSIELLGPADWPTLKAHGLTCAMASGPGTIEHGFNRRENHEKLVSGFLVRLQECADSGIPSVICFSGNRRGQSDEEGLEICAEGLKKIVGKAEQVGVTVCMELLNSRVNHADYQCDHTAWGVELCKRVGSDRFKLLYDIYHMQIMEGDIIRTIQKNHTYIGHYHTGGNPGRNEIDETQELFYPAIMRAIKATGYTGFVGQEFIPKRDPLKS
ncbi:MAG TPA: TIM barrel protein, partial [Opitutaceae bacterium]|nr:TIM barrel protein [Opitutaceae bacterium]